MSNSDNFLSVYEWWQKNWLKGAIGLCCLFMLPGAVRVFCIAIEKIYLYSRFWEPLVIGFLVGTAVYFGVMTRFPSIDRFEHNLTHVVMAALFLEKVSRHDFIDGGESHWMGTLGNGFKGDMVRLAPYYFPTFSFLLALIYPLVPGKRPFGIALFGFTLAYHMFSTIRESVKNWTKAPLKLSADGKEIPTDIGGSGPIFSSLFVLTFTLISHSLCFFLILGGYRNLAPWIATFWHANFSFYGGKEKGTLWFQ